MCGFFLMMICPIEEILFVMDFSACGLYWACGLLPFGSMACLGCVCQLGVYRGGLEEL